MHVLDTDTLNHLHAGDERVISRLEQCEDPEVGTTVVTKIEILKARFAFLLKAADGEQVIRAQDWMRRSEELLEQVTIVGFNQKSVEQFDRLRTLKKLKKIGRADMLIASIALANAAVLVTRNLRHFKQVSGLKLANWVD